MKHIVAGLAIGLLVFTAVGIALALMTILIDLVGINLVGFLLGASILVAVVVAMADYLTERR